jgi:glycosyltransferase involved in cell wall biosynthesis
VRILHVITSMDPAHGGPVEGLLRQCEAMTDCTCEVITLDPPYAPFLGSFAMPIHALGVRAQTSRLARFGYTPRLVPWLKDHAADYDMIVVHGLWNYASAGSSRILPRLGVPYVVYPHGMMDPWFRRIYPLKHLAKQIFWKFFDGRLMEHASAALFTCEEEMIVARGQFHRHPYRELVARYGAGDVPRGAGTQIAAFRAAVPALGTRPYLLFLGRIHPKKGCDLLIRAWAEIEKTDMDLVMAGPDQVGWAKTLRALAEELGVGQRIHWPGLLTGDAKWGAFRAAEAFVLPSHQDSFGVAVGEALACGAPVLMTDKVNVWREVDAAGAGLICPDNLLGVELSLRMFLGLDPSARARMRSAARQCFMEHFNVAISAKKTCEIYRQLAQSRA